MTRDGDRELKSELGGGSVSFPVTRTFCISQKGHDPKVVEEKLANQPLPEAGPRC